MPLFLGDYEGAAKNREAKFVRAVESFRKQTHTDKKLIIICDGDETCRKAEEILDKKVGNMSALFAANIYCFGMLKQPPFSGVLRNEGINYTDCNVITYLDSDDYLDSTHLEMIAKQIGSSDFVYWNDKVNDNGHRMLIRDTEFVFGKIGTSCFAHKKSFSVNWKDGYGHDFYTVMDMKSKTENYKKIAGCGYVVCHLPNALDC